ncbi:MAG: hypothetical protein IT367_00715 [Candidatus Hydrogenedentes bacterium]|nr:hypothetical protein [Candidatus Hydrogenedentota bacterium]
MPQRSTTLGTPAAPSWSAEWLARVESEETARGRRICGAATMGAGPCLLASDHPSGRCRYHGGVPTVGPPSDNQNARIHGLYARRLQRCGDHCPMWKSCPFAGQDVLDLPQSQRPICAYERDEYAALVKHYFNEDVEPAVDSFYDDDESNDETTETAPRRPSRYATSTPECPEPFLLHQLVLLTIMQTRAAAALSEMPLTTVVEVDSPNYKMKTAKPAAALEAFIRIAREYRALRGTIDTKKLMPKPESQGLGSRLKSLMLLTRKAVEESIVDLDAPEYRNANANPTMERTVENPGMGNAASNQHDAGVGDDELPDSSGEVGKASNEAVNSDVNRGAPSSECANEEIDAGNGREADCDGETMNGERGTSSSEVGAPAEKSEPLNQEPSTQRPAEVRPPPLLWSDVLARRSRSRFDDFLFIDRDG